MLVFFLCFLPLLSVISYATLLRYKTFYSVKLSSHEDIIGKKCGDIRLGIFINLLPNRKLQNGYMVTGENA